MKQIIIIEHLEPELWPWCIIEYESISKMFSKSEIWFTNIKKDGQKLSNLGKVFKKSVLDMNLEDACVLDPDAKKTIDYEDSKKFKYFIIGGILGDYPPKKRTKVELTKKLSNAEARNMGKKQFSTDNAVYVLKNILNGGSMKNMSFQNKLTVKINNVESIELPYYYPLVDGKPRISQKLLSYLKSKNDF